MSFLTVVGTRAKLMQLGCLTLDLDRRTVHSRGTRVLVSPAEFDVLALLLTHRNVPMSKEHIADSVFGPAHGRDPRQIDMFVARLRRSLRPVGLDHLVATIAGRGYAALDDRGTPDELPRFGTPMGELLRA